MCSVQRRCRTDRGLHNAEYRARANEVRGRRRHVPDRQHVTNTAAVHGPVRGIPVFRCTRFHSVIAFHRHW